LSTFEWPVRVYYEDTDAAGVVYYANYLKFLERGRTEWLRTLGFAQDTLMRDAGIVFAVRRVEIDYLRPARFDDALVVASQMDVAGRASLTFRQRLLRDDSLLADARVQVVCLDQAKFRPSGIPLVIRQKMKELI